MVKIRKKLIEVALPLEAINAASVREKSIRHGHPSTLHLWWARRPLAAARAVIFAQMVDDPSSHPELFPTEQDQEKERQRLFRMIENLVEWENTTNETVLNQARDEIWKSWRTTCADNHDHPQAKELFNPDELPAFHDPFAGGGALPLEAQRLGLESYASDLNPVAVLIDKALIEIPPKFVGKPPVNPEIRKNKTLFQKAWHGAEGLAEDVRHYGQWMREAAEKRIGHLYPKVEITSQMVKERPDLRPHVGQELTVIAWIWARTVKSPNPAFAQVDVPLVPTFLLSRMKGNEAYVQPIVEGGSYRFEVRMGKPKDEPSTTNGTKLSRGANFRCLVSGTPIEGDYIKAEGKLGRIGLKMMAVVAEGERGRVYLAPSKDFERVASSARPTWKPEVVISGSTQYLGVKPYGMEQFSQLFTDRQLVALTTLSDLVIEASDQAKHDALAAATFSDEHTPLSEGGTGADAYAQSIAVYLSLVTSSLADRMSMICTWDVGGPTWGTKTRSTFSRQALQMTWSFAEVNPFSSQSGSWNNSLEYSAKSIPLTAVASSGHAEQADATVQRISYQKVVSTDPPYFDNVPYADLSDFFYVWLRRCLKSVFPFYFATVAVPRAEELVAFAYRHKDREAARAFFLEGMTLAMRGLSGQAHPAFPVTIYYAFKQSESDDEEGTVSTGWETFLDAVIRADFSTSGTWPMRTELGNRMRGMDSNALASSIILVCRPRNDDAPTATRREFMTALKNELPVALTNLQHGNIAPVDLAQAAIGPGMGVYTRYSKVLDASGKHLSVREALALINETLDEVLAEQEGDFDSASRWALAWFDQSGFAEGEYGIAELLSKAKNTSVAGMVEANILRSKGGRVRLLRPEELPSNWDPNRDPRLSVWETVHQLIKALNDGGEDAAAKLVSTLGGKADVARELAYRLYTICERRKRSQEALSYNGLVQSWPEIMRLAREGSTPREKQSELFQESEE